MELLVLNGLKYNKKKTACHSENYLIVYRVCSIFIVRNRSANISDRHNTCKISINEKPFPSIKVHRRKWIFTRIC